MNITDVLQLLNTDVELQPFLKGGQVQLFQEEDIEPVDEGARVVVNPISWGDPDEWGSNVPQRRRYSLQVNVESSDLAVSLEAADIIEKTFLESRLFRFGDTIADNIEYLYVVARRYRFSTLS